MNINLEAVCESLMLNNIPTSFIDDDEIIINNQKITVQNGIFLIKRVKMRFVNLKDFLMALQNAEIINFRKEQLNNILLNYSFLLCEHETISDND
jgi:hypothetical protein